MMKGSNEVLRNLNKEIKNIRGKTKKGITEACLLIKAAAVKKTPVDTGNLWNSAFIRVTGEQPDNTSPNFEGPNKNDMKADHSTGLAAMWTEVNGFRKNELSGVVGYTAHYAWYVHEMPPGTNWQRSAAENKFLEKAIEETDRKVIDAIKKHAKI